MTLSVGLAKIVNDPEATILTRKALGRLQTPGLLVTDKGLTIDGNGRFVLRLAAGAGLSEDSSGLAVKLAAGGGITSSADGLALADGDDTFGDITCNSIAVLNDANVGGDVNALGAINSNSVSTGAISGTSISAGAVSCSSITASGAASSNSVSTGAISGTSISAGAVSCSSITASGAASSNSVSTGAIASTSISNSGAVSSGSASISGNASVGGTLTAGAVSGNVNITGSLKVNSGQPLIRMLIGEIILSWSGAFEIIDFTFGYGAAVVGDVAYCSPVSTPSNLIGSWSAAVVANEVVTIRIKIGAGTTGSFNETFRIVVLGFNV